MKTMQKGSIYLIVMFVVVFLIGIGLVILIKNTLLPSAMNNKNQPVVTHGLEDLGKRDSVAAPEDLTIAGIVSGKMTQGRAGSGYECVPGSVGPIIGYINGVNYAFEFKGAIKGPGVYIAHAQIGQVQNKNFTWNSDQAKITINADRRSGSIDANLVNINKPSDKAHLSGTWTCPLNIK